MVERRRRAGVWWGDLMRGTKFSQSSTVFETLLVIYASCEFLLTHSYCERPIDEADEDSVLGGWAALGLRA